MIYDMILSLYLKMAYYPMVRADTVLTTQIHRVPVKFLRHMPLWQLSSQVKVMYHS